MQNKKSCLLSAVQFVILLLSVSPILFAQSTIFNGPRDYVVGSYPGPAVVGDFNGDGLRDVAVANLFSNSISVLLQNSDGTFQTAISYPVGNQPVALQVGHVNSDGKLSLLLINSVDGTLGVLIGNGDGTFQAQKVTAIPAGAAVAVGDFNGDGKVDVAIAVPLPQVGTFGMEVLQGNGDGTFLPSNVSYPVTGNPNIAAAADFNKDGKLDVVTLSNGGISVLLGNGDGTFQTAINTATSTGFLGLVVADFNQDGNLDIATSTSSLILFLGNGDGTFQAQKPIPQDVVPVAAGDLNGDGKPDLIATNNLNGVLSRVESLLNNGDGTFTIGQTLPGSAAAPSDLRGDQKLDLIVGQPTLFSVSLGIVTILQGNGDGTFAIFPSYPAFGELDGFDGFPQTLAATDFTGDGKVDLGVVDFSFVNGAGGTFFASSLVNSGAGFSSPVLYDLGSAFGAGQLSMATGDFNGTGHMGLAVGFGGVGVLLGNGDGTFQPPVFYGGGMTGPVAVGDFNNDGKLDAMGVLNGEVAVLLGNGDGTFGLPVASSVGGSIGFVVKDFNHDGKLDVATIVVAPTCDSIRKR